MNRHFKSHCMSPPALAFFLCHDNSMSVQGYSFSLDPRMIKTDRKTCNSLTAIFSEHVAPVKRKHFLSLQHLGVTATARFPIQSIQLPET